MTFTDDDLKQLKKELLANRRMEWPMPDCEAFVARLEAAEKFGSLARVILSFPHGPDSADIKMLHEANESWKKAAGK